MARRKFTPEEREALVPGRVVTFKNGSQSHSAKVTHAPYTVDGWESVTIEILASKGTMAKGETFPASPGHIVL